MSVSLSCPERRGVVSDALGTGGGHTKAPTLYHMYGANTEVSTIPL